MDHIDNGVTFVKVIVLSGQNDELWSLEVCGNQMSGVTAQRYLSDGTQQRIINALLGALIEARGQLGGSFQNVDAVPYIRLATPKVDSDVPVPRIRHLDTHGKLPVVAAVEVMSAPALKTSEV